MSDSREIRSVSVTVRSFPPTWQGWVASLIVGIFAAAIIALVALLASAIVVVAIVLFVIAIALAVLRLIFSPADIARGFRAFLGNKNARD